MVALLLAAACKPTPSVSGAIGAFRPLSCHVLAGGGLEFSDATQQVLRATFPQTKLDADERLSLDAGVELGAPLGACGRLELTGEGYHADGKRAVRGRLTVDCESAKGELTFSSCF